MSIYSKKRIAYDIMLLLLLAAVHVFQIVYASSLSVWGINPFTLIPAVICVSMYASLPQSVFFSLFLGISCDAVSGGIFGWYGLSLMLLACATAYLCENVISRNILSALIYHICVYTVMTFAVFFGRLVVVGRADGMLGIIGSIWLECAYSALFLPYDQKHKSQHLRD